MHSSCQGWWKDHVQDRDVGFLIVLMLCFKFKGGIQRYAQILSRVHVHWAYSTYVESSSYVEMSVAQQSRRSVLQQRISYSMRQNMSSSVFLAWRRFLALQS